MKKLTKITLICLSLGLVSVNAYLIKRHHQDQMENKILKDIRSRYQGFPIKGTWIQKHHNYYLGGITVMISHVPHNHEFAADRSGKTMLKN